MNPVFLVSRPSRLSCRVFLGEGHTGHDGRFVGAVVAFVDVVVVVVFVFCPDIPAANVTLNQMIR